MTATPPPVPCPACGAALTGAASCAACGLRLTGPQAARLWEVDVALAGLDARRAELTTERARLLAALRPGAVVTAMEPTASSPVAAGAPGPAAVVRDASWMPGVPAPRQEWTPQRVQNTLLGLGVLLLTVAAIVFAAVTYDRLGAGGRAAVLVALTTLAGLVVPRLKTRGLDATAEAVTAVALALAALDAYGLRTLGLAEHSPASVYTAWSALALAAVAASYAAVVPVRLPRFASVVLAHVPVPLLLEHADASAGAVGLALALLATADLAVWVLVSRVSRGSRAASDVMLTLVAAGALTAGFAGAAGTAGAFLDGETPGTLALIVLAAASAAGGVLISAAPVRLLLTALPAPLLATAAVAVAQDRLTDVQRPLVAAAVAVAAMQVAALLPRQWRTGPVAGALLVAAATLVSQVEAVAQALVLPFAWLDQPWTLLAGRDARHALSPDAAWSGTVVTLVVLLAAAVTVAAAGLALHQLRVAAVPTAALVVAAAVVLPLGLATSYPLALMLLLACAVALLTAGITVARIDVSRAVLGAGTAVALLTAAWSSAEQDATLLVLGVLALTFAGVAVRVGEAAGAAGLAAGALLAAGGAARGLASEQVGGLLLIAPAVLVAVTYVLTSTRRIAVEVAAAVLATAAVVLATGDVGWLSWTLALAGLVALADALHPDRRLVAIAGGLLLSASSWVRLADAGVHAPEPYVLPIGVVALALGWLRARRQPGTRSFPAYGPGLSLLLVPSLVAALDDATPTRSLLLAGGCIVVLLVGARQRLQAPLVIGGAVLAVDAVHLLGPYAAALPRWLTLGAAGVLLVAVGATYEQRRRDVARLRQRFDALT